jgi:predicted ester cyclase/2-polyprenyl-3-methyl-5-hydroxy-6-metoxy-1,4-benzoquinol methylase
MSDVITRSPAALVTDVIKRLFDGDIAVLEPHPGLASLKQTFPAVKAAFPDIRVELQQSMVDGDRVAAHWIFAGTHTGPFYGIPPTGRAVRMQNVSIARVDGDRIVEYNSEVGWLQALIQIGALPAPSGANRLLAMGTGYWVSQILRAAVHHRFFTLIANGHTTAAAIASAAKTNPRGTRMVLDSLVALQILGKRGQDYALTPDADAFLVAGRPAELSPMLDDQIALSWGRWAELVDALGNAEAMNQFMDSEAGREFFPKLVRSIIPLGIGPADATAEHLRVGTARQGVRILDVGIGGAAWSIPFARRDARAQITGFDLPEVLVETKKIVAEYAVADRFTFRAGNLLTDDFGSEAFDIVILGNICHGLTAEQNVDLLERIHRALARDGVVVIADMLPNEERTGPPFPVLFAVNMFIMGGADTYPLSDYQRWLGAAGYTRVTTFDTRQSHSPVIIASK